MFKYKTRRVLLFIVYVWSLFSPVLYGYTDQIGLYKGEEATGRDVIALWQFLPGKEMQDSSGHGHELTLIGESRFNPAGKFGACLEITPGQRRGGVTVSNHPSLSPAGAFTIEMLIKPKPEFENTRFSTLIDKMAIPGPSSSPDIECMRGYMMRLEKSGEGHSVVMLLGFGREGGVVTYRTKAVPFEPGQWYHVAFTYDGNGVGRIYINGELAGESSYLGRKAILTGDREVAIGDRGIGRYSPFPGYIDQVRMLNKAVSFGQNETNDLLIVGSPEWIDIFIDRSGGAITDYGYNRLSCPNPTCANYNKATQYDRAGTKPANLKMWSPRDPDVFTCPACGKSYPGKEFPEKQQHSIGGLKFEYYQNHEGNKFFLTPRLRYYKSLHALYTASDMAVAAARSGDKDLARRALDIMLAYKEMYSFHITRPISGTPGARYRGEDYSNIASDRQDRDLQEYAAGWPNVANWGRLGHFGDYVWPSRICAVYQNISKTGIVSEEERQQYKQFVEFMLEYVAFAFYKQAGGMGNFSIQLRSDIFTAYQTFPDLEVRDFVYEQKFGVKRVLKGADIVHEILQGTDGLFAVLGGYYYADGLMHERSPAYQEMITSHLHNFLQTIAGYTDPPTYQPLEPHWLRFENLDLESNKIMQKCLTQHLQVSLPNGKCMALGDSYHDRLDGVVQNGSSLHPGWGVGMLQIGSGLGATMAALNWGSIVDGHSHNDMLDIVFWDKDRLLVNDLGYVIDQHEIRETWWRASAASHNTVIVDAENPAPYAVEAGDPEAWAITPFFSAVQARSRHTYPKNEDYRRTLVLVGTADDSDVPRYAVDVFHVKGGRVHDYLIHAQSGIFDPPETFSTSGLTLLPVQDPPKTMMDVTPGASRQKSTGYEHITALQKADTRDSWSAVWNIGGEEETQLKLFRLIDAPETVFITQAPGHRYHAQNTAPDKGRTMYKVISRSEGRAPHETVFTSVVEAYNGSSGRIKAARRLKIQGENSPVAVEVTTDSGSDIILVSSGPGLMELPEKEIVFNGRIAAVSFDRQGNIRTVMMNEGSYLRVGSNVIKANPETLSGLTVGHPEGVSTDVFSEKPASIEVDFEVPAEAVGRTIFMDHAAGNRTVWTIKKVEPAGHKHTRIGLDRPARHQLKQLQGAGDDGTFIDPVTFDFAHTDRFFEKGVWCLIGDQWTQIINLRNDTGRIFLSEPVRNIKRHLGSLYVVTYIGPGDRVTIPGITYWSGNQ